MWRKRRHQLACKPGSVTAMRKRKTADDHSSGMTLARHLGATYPDTQKPENRPDPVARTSRVPIRFCSRWGLPCQACCHACGGLLPHPFTLAGTPEEAGRWSAFCCTFPGVTPAGRYPAPCFHGARTFLPAPLSVLCRAAVQPAGGRVVRGG